MTKLLRIAPDLSLPLEAVTQTFAVLAKRGAGKTYTTLVIVEEMLKAALHVVVVDPVGVCWGLRSAADGKSAGLAILVLGGEHGDVPLEVTAGETIADFLIDSGQSAVLDLSLFRKGEQVRFMTDFAERLYHRNRQPLMVVLDEADAFAPQRPQHGQERMLGAIEDLVRRGRARGIGVTLVTQRAAVLNKDVLTQVEVLVALRTIAPQDREAIDAWVKVHGTPEQREQLMSSLPSLPIGTAWFWSPGWLDLFQQVHVRKRETFDSSATPTAGAKVADPKRMADVDLSKLRAQIHATIERAKENDPKELRKQIAELKKQAAAKSTPAAAQPVKVERIEVPVISDAQIDRMNDTLSQFQTLAEHHQALANAFKQSYVELRAAFLDARQAAERKPPARPLHAPALRPETLPATSRTMSVASAAPAEGVTGPRQRVLDALAWLEHVGVAMPASKVQVAFLAGQSPTSSTYGNHLGALRSAGLVSYPAAGTVELTDAGRGLATQLALPATAEALQAEVLARLPKPAAAILTVLLAAYPESVSKDEIAAQTGQSPTSSTYGNHLGRLRSLGLIAYPQKGSAIAESILFLERR